MSSVPLPGRRRGFLLVCLLLMCTACASKDARVPEATPAVSLPEVRQMTLHGNTQFSSQALRQVMLTKQRPLLPPWRRAVLLSLMALDEQGRLPVIGLLGRGKTERLPLPRIVEQAPDRPRFLRRRDEASGRGNGQARVLHGAEGSRPELPST